MIYQFAALFLQVTSQAWVRSDVHEPQPGVNCWREPYVPGNGCSGQVTSGPLLPPIMVRLSVGAALSQLLGSTWRCDCHLLGVR